jgi:diguanylate cyclase (GGDEF)-like protein
VIEVSQSTRLVIALVVVVYLVALAGAAGYDLLLRHRRRRLAAHLERLAGADGEALRDLATVRVADASLRGPLESLTARLTATWQLATTDELTGILNRQALLARLDEELRRAARYHRPLSVALVDLDHFKRLNDSFGHMAGDRVLRGVAAMLRREMRAQDILGRYGGEEFMLVLPETDADAAAMVAEKLRRLVAVSPVALDDGSAAVVTLSAGVAGGMGGQLDLDALIRDADAALYSAKSLGRDQIYVFNEVHDDRVVRRAPIDPQARAAADAVGRAALDAAVMSLTSALDGRRGWEGGPSTLIADAATAMARSLGLPEPEVERIRVASLLHDLGKLAIPDEILSKPSELAEGEWRVVTEHPKVGQVVLEQAGALRDAATIVLHHHEWYDGRGYPHGLKGREIPLGARIVAVADAYEAMVSGRPYQAAVTHEAAIAELRRHAGLQFDPDLVEEFIHLFGGASQSDGRSGPAPAATTESVDRTRSDDRLRDRRRRAARSEAPPAGGRGRRQATG